MSTNISFKGGLPADCTCPICDQALREPIKLNCDHFYCKSCLTEDAQNCAICQTLIQHELCVYDKEKHKQIQNLPVVCSFEEIGCDWSGTLSELSSHLENCPKKSEKCSKCGREFEKSDFARHFEKCGKKDDENGTTSVCSFCLKRIRLSDFEKHLKTCQSVIISCPFQCGLVDKTRKEIEDHRPLCPNVDNVCPFIPFGCNFAGGRENIQKHLSDEPIRHLMLLCDEITDLKLTYEMMEKDLDTFNIRQTGIIENAETCHQMFGPQIIWRIDNIMQRTNEAKSGANSTIFSAPFMSHRFGYKMMACVCLFGDGIAAGKSLSLYVLILRGEFDATLQWPFNRSIKFTLLDQNPNIENRLNITYHVDPRKLRANETFLARPRGERNAAFGSQSFCSLSILNNYIKDDQIFVKVEIERCETILKQRDVDQQKTLEQIRASENQELPPNVRVVPVVQQQSAEV
ncbi:unnamed protein product [Caenorhabditis angaria]|uniref:Uncharacterized protein n=1 Tax=Caenorhabditis angaria TaxID=860376 RepID=A0A9P1IIX7_9PELO|nr:unnamed protein product [Caenorhabditis angaria]